MRSHRLPDIAIDVIDEAGAEKSLHELEEGTQERKIQLTDIKNTIAKMAQFPSERLSSSDRESLAHLGSNLKNLVFGQDKAVDMLERTIRISRSGLARADKPIGSFMFSGPTGVGKTELARQLALQLGISFLRFDMSEYMERHAVSRLIGAPPGYVGYDSGGLLTDGVKKNPYAVLLLDEIEKAHPDVHNILLQIMDHGTLTDANGRATDFRNVVIIMTTNVGAAELSQSRIGFTKEANSSGKDNRAIKQAFSPEFRNRLDGIVSFNPLAEQVMLSIVDKFLVEIVQQLAKRHLRWEISLEAREFLARRGYDPHFGARPLARLIDEQIRTPLANILLFQKLPRQGLISVTFDEVEDKLCVTGESRKEESTFAEPLML
jgi:ATP-dependent Clp protease ATP-binding subunit ClpA